jgi:hypothetical protein
MPDAGRLEERVVEVNDPKLTADANHRLTLALREVIGTDRVRVPADRVRVSQGERPPASLAARVTATKAMVVGTLAVAVGVGMIIATTGGSWFLTGVAVFVLAIALAVVVVTIIGLASTPEYPDPGLVALLAEQGYRDPEVRFSELVHEFTPAPDEPEDRSTAVEDDPAEAAAEQTEAVTPSGGPSTAVGPGSSGE